MKQPVHRRGRSLGIWAMALTALAHDPNALNAVACPDPAAQLKVLVFNPTSTAKTVTLIGNVAGNSCTSASTSYNKTDCVAAPGVETPCTLTNLNSGTWKHRITYALGVAGNQQTVNQYQRSIVLAGASEPATIRWTYFPRGLTVDKTGDAGGGSCPVNALPSNNCDIRKAIETANALTPSPPGSDPVLIQVKAGISPGTLSGTSLEVTREDITLDGTDSNGDPWIVADPTRAGAGLQSPFTRSIQFPANQGLKIRGEGIVVRGFEVKQVIDPGIGASTPVIEVATTARDFALVNSRVDGGMAQTCSEPQNNCGHQADAIRVPDQTGPLTPGFSSITTTNVEIRSAVDKGLELGAHAVAAIRNTWLHNNYKGNMAIEDSGAVVVDESVIERAGLRNSDDLLVRDFAAGMSFTRPNDPGTNPPATSFMTSTMSLYRNNAAEGIFATGGGATLQPMDDALCGNRLDGLYTADGPNGGSPKINSSGGLGAMYNGSDAALATRRHGVSLFPRTSVGYDLDDDSVFVSNKECGLFNRHSTIPVAARRNQWAGTGPEFFDECEGSGEGGGPVDSSDAVSELDVGSFAVFAASPSDAMLANQTIRVSGLSFKAVSGNPAEDAGAVSCNTGIDGAVLADSCCRKHERSNTCSPLVGNCVQLRDSANTFHVLRTKSVTPRVIEAATATNVSCLGSSNEFVRVTKQGAVGGPTSRDAAHCVPTVQ